MKTTNTKFAKALKFIKDTIHYSQFSTCDKEDCKNYYDQVTLCYEELNILNELLQNYIALLDGLDKMENSGCCCDLGNAYICSIHTIKKQLLTSINENGE